MYSRFQWLIDCSNSLVQEEFLGMVAHASIVASWICLQFLKGCRVEDLLGFLLTGCGIEDYASVSLICLENVSGLVFFLDID